VEPEKWIVWIAEKIGVFAKILDLIAVFPTLFKKISTKEAVLKGTDFVISEQRVTPGIYCGDHQLQRSMGPG